MRRAAWLLLLAVTAAGVLLLFVFPGRTLLTQDHDISEAQQQITAIDRENAALRAKQAALSDPAEIEQLARERFGLVQKGQRAYAITAPTSSTTLPPTRKTTGPGTGR